MAVEWYLSREEKETGKEFFFKWEETIRRGMRVLPLDEKGLIYNDPADPHSPYGFTDCIGKTGSLLMESLLWWRACGIFAERCRKYGSTAEWAESAKAAVERNLLPTFTDPDSPMLLAATADCRQIDVWGSCYAVSVGFPLPENVKRGIAAWLCENYDGIVERGQVRHNAPGEYWQRCLVDVPHDWYQNGAFWATATGWLMDAILPVSPALAEKTLDDVFVCFCDDGIYECICGEYKQLPNYVASATNIYSVAKKMLARS